MSRLIRVRTTPVTASVRKQGGDLSVIDPEGDVVTVPRTRSKTKRPPKYKVIMLNDDFTPMDFVVFILKKIFRKDQEEAVEIMLQIHNNGSGLCGIFPRDVAETKVGEVMLLAKQNDHPLKCVIERE